MGWKTINNTRYYYHMMTCNGVTRSTYKGNGIDALLCDARVIERRVARGQRKADNAALIAQLELEEQSVTDYHKSMDELYRAWKEAEGYYLHSGSWRKRGIITRRSLTMSLRVDPVTPIEREKVRREFASGNVDFLITLHQGNPATLAFDRLLSAVSDGAYHREACRRKFRKLKQSLAGPESSQIVKLMAAGVAFAWFDVYFADARYYMRMNLDDNALVESYDRRRHRAARRLNRAIKQLADVQQSTLANVYQRIPRFEFMTGVGAN